MEQLFHDLSQRFSGKTFTKEDLIKQYIHQKNNLKKDIINYSFEPKNKDIHNYINFGPKQRTTQYL